MKDDSINQNQNLKIDEAVDRLLEKVGKKIVLAAPLGAGKANHLLNAIYNRAKKDESIELTFLTALTLQKPIGKSLLEKRFIEPFADRVFGDYPNLDYENDRLANRVPGNIEIVEFYFRAGQFVNHNYGQRNYLSSNYTHVVRDCTSRGVNVICQQVSKGSINGKPVFSLSCNPDTSKDLVDELRRQGKDFVAIAQVNQDLPFMYGEAIVAPSYFDIVVDQREMDYPVFAPPKMSVSDADFLIGLHSSTLVKDDGEIQIGIGSLADALVYGLSLRQQNNAKYLEILDEFEISKEAFPVIESCGSFSSFERGLFAATEMLVDSFAELYKAGILKKKVYDSVRIQRLLNQGRIKEEFGPEIFDILVQEKAIAPVLNESDFLFLKDFGIIREGIEYREKSLFIEDGTSVGAKLSDIDLSRIVGKRLRNGAVAHGGFFLGPRAFYDFLKELPEKERKLFRMKRISQINHLYGHEEVDRLQRINGRFINTCMKVTLNGSASSDALEDGNQISGVGGQYNFVAMAHELPDARSILQLRSTRYRKNGKLESNIVFNYGNCTIPRHLRDIVVTEYGIADLRGKTDEEVAIQLIQVSDSRFQDELIDQAIRANKLKAGFKLNQRFRNNLPKRYSRGLKKFKGQNLFDPFPFGTDLTDVEIKVGRGLKKLKKMQKSQLLLQIAKSFTTPMRAENRACLERMKLDQPTTFEERVMGRLLNSVL